MRDKTVAIFLWLSVYSGLYFVCVLSLNVLSLNVLSLNVLSLNVLSLNVLSLHLLICAIDDS